ncbi:undecaprenyl-phosphate 4-deoxy-4-formamido-L-arabinose transferase [Nocardioides terrae]|uniref:Undecaprenyl-phosphate 4-deoxy-4-formamido-L-arabinose transferase n=1 Tax=Nocardioides terrae TaxID=574651 RepID=A0A1I1ISR1_9ACTN|nr:glycosyltransferase family 2 protein [Nocardioides terrae]SFC39274.1 undecaprenyl-phosphate 4-deoxy-4-formamido-L-arabinose transferase [Nocardioides terrae]
MSVSVVVPCYRSASTLPRLVQRLVATFESSGSTFEVLLVVDGSPDDTWDVAHALSEMHSAVRAIRLSRNYGQHSALLAGIRLARYQTTVTMDDDLQHLPEEVPTLLDALSSEHELVYGVARVEEHGWVRSLASRSVKSALSLTLQIEGARDISAFRAFHTYLRDAFVGATGPDINLDVALSWATNRATRVDVRMAEREEGASNYTPRLLIRHALNMVLGYSTAPLRFVIYLGLACGLLGAVLLASILVAYFTDRIQVAGFTTLASMIAIFSSAQMVAVGVLGEYIGRLHHANAGRPTYIIRERSDVSAHPELPED